MNASLRLVDIRIEKFEIFNIEEERSIDYDKYEFEFSNTITFYDDRKFIKSGLTISLFKIEDSNTKITLAELSLATYLELKNFDEIIVKESEQLKVPNFLLGFINSLVVNNARGVLVSKLENTPYSNAILPLIPPYSSDQDGYTLFSPSHSQR